MHHEHHGEEDTPAQERANTAAEPLSIEQEPDGQRADNLGHPIHEVVEGTGADVE